MIILYKVLFLFMIDFGLLGATLAHNCRDDPIHAREDHALFDFYGDNDPGGSDLCNPYTDTILVAAMEQCKSEGGKYWCCDGADCLCFDRGSWNANRDCANDFCEGWLGQTTCRLPVEYQQTLHELESLELCDDGGITTDVVYSEDINDLMEYVVSTGYVDNVNQLESLQNANKFKESNFYEGFQLWFDRAIEENDTEAIANFERAEEILDEFIDYLGRDFRYNAQRIEFGGGQYDSLYFYDWNEYRIIKLHFSCV